MGEFFAECPTVAVIRGSEVRFSVDESKIRRILNWPLSYVSCGEITPNQPRLQWGVPTHGARYDSFSGLTLGNARNNLTLGSRSTYVSGDSPMATLETQRVGVATVTLGGRVRFKYWNDHAFWWWPIGDGGDRGDTAGLQFSYNLGAHQLEASGWMFNDLSLTMRLASGIPNRNSAVPQGDGEVHTEVQFPSVDRGDIELSTSLTNRNAQRLELGITVNTGAMIFPRKSGHQVRSLSD